MRKKNFSKTKKFSVFLRSILLITITLAFVFTVKGITKDNTNQNDEQNIDEKSSEERDVEVANETKTVAPNVKINIKATGDIMFHPSQIDGAYNQSSGIYDFTNSFRAVKEIFQTADLAIGNFEGTTAGNLVYAYQGYPIFNAPDEVLDALKDAGFDVLTTVNNHCLDTRKQGIINTIEKIQSRGMDTVGTYKEKPKTRVLIKDVKGIKIAFLAYTEMVNGLEVYLDPIDLEAMVNIIDEMKIKEDIKYAKEENADIIVASMHWGNEYERIQTANQEILAEMMLTEGVDIILGSHPHVIQPSKIYEIDGKKKFVIYSMGNFISNQRIETLAPYGMTEQITKYTEDGIIVDIEIEKNGETNETYINNIEYIPLWVYKGKSLDGRDEHIVYPIMNYIESDELNEKSKNRMNRSFSDTMAQMDIDNN